MPRLSRVSFDYDSTLSEPEVSTYFVDLLNRGFDCWIITARPPETLVDINRFIGRVRANKEHLVATNLQYKYDFIKEVDPIFHIDDDWLEVNLAKRYTNSIIIRYGYNPKWKAQCEDALNKYKDKYGFALKPTRRGKRNEAF